MSGPGDGPVPTERIGYRLFLQPPAVSATVASISGVDVVSDYPGVDSMTVHQGPGAVSTGRMVRAITLWRSWGPLRTTTNSSRNELLRDEVKVTYVNLSHDG